MVGSIAGVVAAAAAIVFGVIPLIQARREQHHPPAVGAPRPEVPSPQAMQVDAGNKRVNQYIQTYIEYRHPPGGLGADRVVVGEVPQQAPAFQPRGDLAARLGQSGPGITVVRAVTGMRGVGKTQVAAAYARSCIDAGWRLVAWVNAAERAQALNGLADIATALDVRKPGVDLERVGQAVRRHLEADGKRCLVVFDNAADLDWLARFAPSAGRCQVIITSNQVETAGLGEPVAVDVFSEQEALAFLAQRIGRSDRDGARQLADELGFLPLALAQAAAMIAAQHLDYPIYMARLRAVPVQDILKRVIGEPYPHGVAEAIVLALDAAADGDPTGLCPGLINVIALLSAAGVSRALLYAAGQQGLLQHRSVQRRRRARSRHRRPAGPERIDETLGRLASASLLTFSADDATVAAHRLTMRVAVERQARDGTLARLGAGIAALLTAVTQSLPEPLQNRPAARDAIQQIMALHEHLTPYLGDQDAALIETLLQLRNWAISSLNDFGDSFAQVIDYGEALVADTERLLGDTHPHTLISRNNLASAYRDSGRLDEAISLYECTLADFERVLGCAHPRTLTCRNNLAYAYRVAGRLDEAISLQESTVADREQVLGQTHEETLRSRDNLASAYQDAGRLEEAISLFERALADRELVLGETHPDTGSSRNNLALAYRDTGRLDEAISLFECALADHVQVLGETHPETLTCGDNLAGAYWKAGRLDEAISLYERTLANTEPMLSQTHPNILRCCNNLAGAYQAAGRLDDAISLYERTLANAERVLGRNRGETQICRDNLARAYRAAGRLDKARRLDKTKGSRNRLNPGS